MIIIRAEVITIGDEILYGQITDTNTQWISYEIDQIGIKTIRKSSVGDSEEEILTILHEAEKRADIIFITGGLGPTKDDITKKTLCTYFGSELVLNQDALEDVRAFYHKRNRELNDINRQQAYLPNNCTRIPNKQGTAPGMWFERNGKIFISMPGVPHEMRGMMSDFILDELKKKIKLSTIQHRIIRTIGVPESMLAEKIEKWEIALPEYMKLAYLPSIGQVKLRLSGWGKNDITLQEEMQEQIIQVTPLIQEFIYSEKDQEIEEVIGELLIKHNKKIAFAESCTGGYISHSLTKIPGSSQYFNGCIIPYQNEFKINNLGVKKETIAQHGAVSEETVREMATQVRLLFKSDIGIASTGIAGPGGATPEKPVGTIWIAYADEKKVVTKKLLLGGTRLINIQGTAMAVFNLVRMEIGQHSL